MLPKFRAMVWLSLKAMLSTLRLGGRRRVITGVGAVLFMAGLAGYLSCMYSFSFARQLAQVDMLPLLMAIMPVMAVTVGLCFTLMAAQGVVFGGKDNDLMLSLPVPPSLLLFSRALALYLENLLICLFVLLPAGAAYQFYGGGGGVWLWLALVPGAALIALLPTLAALICGFALAWLTGHFPRNALLSTVFYGAALVVVMVGVFRLNGLMLSIGQSAAGLQAGLAGWGLPFLLLEQAVCLLRPQALLALAALCMVPFGAVVWLLGRWYQPILSRLTTRAGRWKFRLKRLRTGSPFCALVAKEARRFFNTPIYLFNTGFGLLLLLGGGIAALIFRTKVRPVLYTLEAAGAPVLPLLATALAFVLSTVAITACSISLEGKCLWLLLAAPVSIPTLLAAKAAFQLLLVLPCLCLCVACLALALGLEGWATLLLLVVTGAFALCCAPVGLWCNLLFPRLDAPNDTVIVKQSLSALLGTIIPMLLAALAAGLYLLLAPAAGEALSLLACALVFVVLATTLTFLLSRYSPYFFLKEKVGKKNFHRGSSDQ